ncbi:MAG: DegV family protein [Chloroflexota bacterium]|nr:DegV family protein [Chloroflexota bacterium]
MARVAIVTDSTADLPPSLRDQHHVTVVPLNVHFGNEVYRDQVDITTDAFMERLQRSPVLPTTSQPASGLFEETFRDLAADHDGVVAVLISGKLSGTVMSATIARDAVADLVPVEVVDSRNASLGLGFQVLRAAELAAEGMSAPDIAARLQSETAAYHLVFFVDTLEYLQRGGRIGKAAAMVGSMLNLKPLLRVDEGQIVPFERTRTRGRARRGLIDFARSLPRTERLAVVHSTPAAEAEQLAAELSATALLPRDRMVVAQFGPVIGTHVGPGAMGVGVYEGETS